jgi:type VI secretion system secreted protein VgrG
VVLAPQSEESDGGLARYRLSVGPWLQLLAHSRRNQLWQGRSVVEIVESVFAQYARFAAWEWAPCVADQLASSPWGSERDASLRELCIQYRQTDLGFVLHLLAEEGLNTRFEPYDDNERVHNSGGCGSHRLTLPVNQYGG